MASITHSSHEHPLILLKQHPVESKNQLVCYGCLKRVSLEKHDSDLYGCEICETFFLHKSCAELPREITHRSHEQHPLFLLFELPPCPDYLSDVRRSFRKAPPYGFFYHCYLDNFVLDTKCALKKESLVHFRKDLILNHPSHKRHPLTLQPRPTSFRCDACYVEDKDLSYQCTSCHYLIHRRCAMLPSRATHPDVHTHPLSLSFGLPSQYHYNFNYSCDICKKWLFTKLQLWLYYCEFCRFFVHIKCMAIKKPQIQVDLKGLNIDDLPHLPMSDKSVELIQRFLLGSNNIANIDPEISIFSHEHPLLYSNDKQIIEDGNEDGEEVLCDGCIEPIISPPYYHCAECNYFLHLPCAKLPHQLQHPSHPHPLILTCKSRFYQTFSCNRCHYFSNGFCFCCTAGDCYFHLDVKCAALPDVIQHETHNHPLVQIFERSLSCSGCDSYISRPHKFGCDSCKFNLQLECLMLPKTTRHRLDSKHPLILRYPPHYYHPRPLDCAECEEEINPNFWLYHCEECDLSFHVYCINRSRERYISKFGQKLKIISHPHPLKFVYAASVKSPCHGCRQKIYYHAFECEICNFHLCQECVNVTEAIYRFGEEGEEGEEAEPKREIETEFLC